MHEEEGETNSGNGWTIRGASRRRMGRRKRRRAGRGSFGWRNSLRRSTIEGNRVKSNSYARTTRRNAREAGKERTTEEREGRPRGGKNGREKKKKRTVKKRGGTGERPTKGTALAKGTGQKKLRSRSAMFSRSSRALRTTRSSAARDDGAASDSVTKNK